MDEPDRDLPIDDPSPDELLGGHEQGMVQLRADKLG